MHKLNVYFKVGFLFAWGDKEIKMTGVRNNLFHSSNPTQKTEECHTTEEVQEQA